MAENTKKKGLDLPQTRGTFQVRGKVTGTERDSFYTEKITKTGKPWRSVNFGVQFKPEETISVGLNGMEKENVYFTKRGENGGKSETKTIPWKDRFNFAEDGFSLIGVNVGVTKTKDAKGNDVNDKKHLTDYDACLEVSNNLVDEKTVFIKGNIEYSSYQDGETSKHSTKFVPNQISLGKDIDFTAEDFKPNAKFTQTIVYTGIEKTEDGRFALSAKIVNYNSIEDVEFIVVDTSLANTFRKQLKPYTSINVWGDISVEKDITEVESTDVWGQKNDMKRVNNPTKRELIITGADPETIDTNTYSEAEIDKAIEMIKASKAAENDFGKQTDGWGSGKLEGEDEDMGW